MKNNLNFHPLVEKTRKSINKSLLYNDFLYIGRVGLNIHVTPKCVDRALKVMDTLIKALEGKGAQVSVINKEDKNTTCVHLSGVVLEVDMYEKMNIVKNTKVGFLENKVNFVPNGKLAFRINNTFRTRKEWQDEDNRKLEDMIDVLIEGLNKAVVKNKEQQKIWDGWEEERKKRAEIERLNALEQERIVNLEKEVIRWQKSSLIRSYVEAATKAYIQKNGKIEPGSEFDKWRIWANKKADNLDHLVPEPSDKQVNQPNP